MVTPADSCQAPRNPKGARCARASRDAPSIQYTIHRNNSSHQAVGTQVETHFQDLPPHEQKILLRALFGFRVKATVHLPKQQSLDVR